MVGIVVNIERSIQNQNHVLVLYLEVEVKYTNPRIQPSDF